jgi:DNA-binding transcriptional regulator YhcF (GntR family)
MAFVKIDRRLFATDMWKESRKFSRIEAWLDLQQRAAYRDGDGMMRGDVVVSIRKTAAHWGWEKDAVLRFLRRLVREGLLAKTDRKGIYSTVVDTNRDTDRDTKGANNQSNTQAAATPNETQTATPHLSYNKKDINKKGGVCLSHTPTPREEVRVTDHDWKRFQEWADEKIHWMSGNITREMYTGMRQKVNNSRLLADILIRIYLSGEYETPQQINEQFGKFTA